MLPKAYPQRGLSALTSCASLLLAATRLGSLASAQTTPAALGFWAPGWILRRKSVTRARGSRASPLRVGPILSNAAARTLCAARCPENTLANSALAALIGGGCRGALTTEAQRNWPQCSSQKGSASPVRAPWQPLQLFQPSN